MWEGPPWAWLLPAPSGLYEEEQHWSQGCLGWQPQGRAESFHWGPLGSPGLCLFPRLPLPSTQGAVLDLTLCPALVLRWSFWPNRKV